MNKDIFKKDIKDIFKMEVSLKRDSYKGYNFISYFIIWLFWTLPSISEIYCYKKFCKTGY